MCRDEMKEPIVQAAAVTDANAVPAVKARDSIAYASPNLEELFRAHHEQIFRAAYRITNSATDAEDVLQTIFLRLVRREEQTNPAPNPGSYFHRAAVNAALDLMRGRQRTPSVPLDEWAQVLIENPRTGPEGVRATRELRSIVQQAVARLGKSAAEMFALRYFEGYDNREIAVMLGTSQMVVAVVLHRARAKVRKEVGKFLEVNHDA